MVCKGFQYAHKHTHTRLKPNGRGLRTQPTPTTLAVIIWSVKKKSLHRKRVYIMALL